MTWAIFLGIAALVGFVFSIMTPIVKLNSAITKLSCSIDAMNKRLDETQSITTKRLDCHGKEIDGLKQDFAQITAEHAALKEKVDYFHHN